MTLRHLFLALLLTVTVPLLAQEPHGELAKVKERELEEVRERISDLKKSMDRSAAERERIPGSYAARWRRTTPLARPFPIVA